MLIVVMPPNLTAFMKELISIVFFDYISKYWKWREHPNFIHETPNCFINLTTVIFMIFFWYFKVIIVEIIRIMTL